MYRQFLVTVRRIWVLSLLALPVSATLAQAQVEVGDNLKMNLNGNLAVGYSGDYGDSGSGHGTYGAGAGQLSGFFYNPQFLSFTVNPFYNRNQDNASFTSVLSDTGVDANVNLFGGSRFPGSVGYSKSFIKGSQYGIPGSGGLTSDSSNRNFNVTWSELLPDMPSLTATFADNASSSTLQGETGTTDSASRTFNAMSNYRIAGFGLNAFLMHQNFSVKLPAFLSPTNATSSSSGTSYGFSANHPLPFSGVFTAGYNRTDYSSESGAYANNGTTDTADSMVAFQPTQRLTVNGEIRYTGNLIGALQQSQLPGAPPPLPTNDQASHAVSVSTYGSYNLGRGFILIGYANRQTQHFEGVDTTSNRAGGTLTYRYSQPLFGMLYFSFGLVNNASNYGGGSLGYVGNVSLKKQIAHWQVDTDFSYAQNVQTIIANYTTSNYSYGGMLRRRFGASSSFTTSYRGMESGLTQLPGYSNRSDTFMALLNRGRYGFSGSYAKSHGTALLSSGGILTPNVLSPLISPDQAIYSGEVYGAGISVVPMRKMIINVNWYRTRSDTETASVFSANNSERLYGQMQYNLRKLSFRAGYWRVNQGISADGHPPTTVNTYFFNISRWFNVF
ncbi:MAG: hypothetical protein HY010_22610 [Acidobacteria bacterium]|nr:hypothetical protein [Acidobacteriota bacterium]